MAQDPLTAQLLSAAGGEDRIVDRVRELERRLLALVAAPDTCGYVNSAGARQAGSGFTSSKISTGRYRLTFARPFTPYPVVIAMGGKAASPSMVEQNDGSTPTSTIYEVQVVDSRNGAVWDCDFWFVARQP